MAQTTAERYTQRGTFAGDCPFQLMLTPDKAIIEIIMKHTTVSLRIPRDEWDRIIAQAEIAK